MVRAATARFDSLVLRILSYDITSQGISFVTGVLIARVLGPAALGTLVLLQIVPQYAEKFLRLGIDQASIYLGNGSKRETCLLYISSGIVLMSLVSIGAAGLFWMLREPFQHALLKTILASQWPIIVVTATIPVAVVYRAVMWNLLQFEEIGLFTSLNNVVPTVLKVCGLVGVWVTGDILSALVGYLLSVAIGVWGGIWFLRRQGVFSFTAVDFKIMKELATTGFRQYAATVAQFLHYRIDIMLVGYFLLPAMAGLYSLASNFAMILFRIPAAVTAIQFPRSVKAISEEEARKFTTTLYKHTWIVLAALLAPTWGGVWMITRFGLEVEFHALLVPFSILLVATIPMAISQILTTHYFGRGKASIPLLCIGLTLMINLVCNMLVIPSHGITGAGLVSLLTYSIAAGLLTICFVDTGAVLELWKPTRSDLKPYMHLLRRTISKINPGLAGA